MATFTQRLTQTLRLDALATTLGFTATGCCPTCRLVQPVIYGQCVAGCGTRPRRIAAGDEEFFEPIPGSLQVIPEDPQRLRWIRIAAGMVGYVAAGIFLVRYVIVRGRLDLIPVAIAAAGLFPISIAIFPKLTRKPLTVSNELSGEGKGVLAACASSSFNCQSKIINIFNVRDILDESASKNAKDCGTYCIRNLSPASSETVRTRSPLCPRPATAWTTTAT